MKFTKEISKSQYLEEDMRCFLNVIFLHYSGVITDEKLAGMFKSLRAGTLFKFRRTYYSDLNDKWYRDEKMSDILEDVWITAPGNKRNSVMEFEVLLKYMNKLISKNRNFCIDAIFFQIVKPILSLNQDYAENKRLFQLEIPNYEERHYKNIPGLTDGHCCDDCSGPEHEYAKSNYEFRIVPDNKKAMNSYCNSFFYPKRDNVGTFTTNDFHIF